MVVTQTQVDSLRRMDVSVRRAEAPEDSSLTNVTGFYGTAIGAAGGGSVDWVGAQSGDPADEGDDAGDGDGGGDGGGDTTTPPGESPPVDPQPTPDPSEDEE
jgi:hypothetical protein